MPVDMAGAGGRRVLVSVRLSAQGLAEVDGLAGRWGVSRSAAVRRLLAEAVEARKGRTVVRP